MTAARWYSEPIMRQRYVEYFGSLSTESQLFDQPDTPLTSPRGETKVRASGDFSAVLAADAREIARNPAFSQVRTLATVLLGEFQIARESRFHISTYAHKRG